MKHSSFLLSCALLFSSPLFCMDTVEMDEGAGAPLAQDESEREAEDPLAENPPDTNNQKCWSIKTASNIGIPLTLSCWGFLVSKLTYHSRDSSAYVVSMGTHFSLYLLSLGNVLCFCLCEPNPNAITARKRYEGFVDLATYGIIAQELYLGTELAKYSLEQTYSDMFLGLSSAAFCIKAGLDLKRRITYTKNRRSRRSQSDIESSKN